MNRRPAISSLVLPSATSSKTANALAHVRGDRREPVELRFTADHHASAHDPIVAERRPGRGVRSVGASLPWRVRRKIRSLPDVAAASYGERGDDSPDVVSRRNHAHVQRQSAHSCSNSPRPPERTSSTVPSAARPRRRSPAPFSRDARRILGRAEASQRARPALPDPYGVRRVHASSTVRGVADGRHAPGTLAAPRTLLRRQEPRLSLSPRRPAPAGRARRRGAGRRRRPRARGRRGSRARS